MAFRRVLLATLGVIAGAVAVLVAVGLYKDWRTYTVVAEFCNSFPVGTQRERILAAVPQMPHARIEGRSSNAMIIEVSGYYCLFPIQEGRVAQGVRIAGLH
jgi:hypothetical protein